MLSLGCKTIIPDRTEDFKWLMDTQSGCVNRGGVERGSGVCYTVWDRYRYWRGKVGGPISLLLDAIK